MIRNNTKKNVSMAEYFQTKYSMNSTKILMLNILIAILYMLTGKLSFALFQEDMIVTMTVFIPEGIALTAVLIYGYRIVPAIFLGQILLALDSGLSLVPTLGIAIVNALEALMAYKLFYAYKLDKSLSDFRSLVGLLLLIVFVLQPFSAIVGNTILHFAGMSKESDFLENIFFWWFGNMVGQVLIVPMLLIIYFNTQSTKKRILLFVALLFLGINYTLQVLIGVHNISLLLLVTLPLVIYLATVNLSYATVSTLGLVVSSLYLFHFGQGSFVGDINPIDGLINLNFFILCLTILVLIIGILFREKETAIAFLLSKAHYDPLTGLPNRYMLDDEIERRIYSYKRFAQESAICFIDIDGFKAVNDNYGHDVGDKLLKKVAKEIHQSIRLDDSLLRLGGDEFILILSHIDKEQTKELLERVMWAIGSIDVIEHHKIDISLSIGVANCPANGLCVQELINAADEAMYQVKKSGKDAVVFAE